MLRRTLIGAAVTLALAVTHALAQTKSEGRSKPPAKAKKARPESARLQVYVQGDSAFDPGASELKAEGKSQLDKMLKTAKDGSKRDPRPLTITSVVISGHTDKLEADMPAMLAEHKDIEAALKRLHDAATAEKNAAGIQFAEHLAAHAQEEEEFTYPTALLIGKYVQLKAAQGAR